MGASKRKMTVKEAVLARMRAANGYKTPAAKPVPYLGFLGIIEQQRRGDGESISKEAAERAAIEAAYAAELEGDDGKADAE